MKNNQPFRSIIDIDPAAGDIPAQGQGEGLCRLGKPGVTPSPTPNSSVRLQIKKSFISLYPPLGLLAPWLI